MIGRFAAAAVLALAPTAASAQAYPAKSAPDGYSLLIASPSSISVNPALNAKLDYKPSTSSASPRSRRRRC